MARANTKRVVVIQPIHEAGTRLLDERDDVEWEVVTDVSEENLRERLRDADGCTLRSASLPASVIEAAERMTIVSRHGVGYDSIDVAALTRRRIPLAIAVDCNAISVAEQAFAFMIATAKRMPQYDQATRAGRWDDIRMCLGQVDLHGRTVMVVGFGRIGRQIAPRCQAFGMRVLVVDPFVDAGVIREAGFEAVDDIDAALPEVDAVTVHTPLNDETRGLLGRDRLTRLKQGAIVVNCARGGIVDEAALIEALDSGHLLGAGLDVFVPEPPQPDHPLFDRDDVILSPHSAGLTLEAGVRSAVQSVQNVLDTFDGRLDPRVVVNREVLD